MRLGEIRTIASVLRKEVGWSWPAFLLRCLLRRKSVFAGTHWAADKGDESRFARRVCLSVALYVRLKERLGGERALQVMRDILVPIGSREQLENARSLSVQHDDDMHRLQAFYDFMGKGGVGKFVERTIVEQSENVLSYEVRGCLFSRVYSETGTPELTQFFCEVDRDFFPKAFPDLEFHRGGSWENTVAYGKDHCTFIFERKTDGGQA